VNTNQQAKIKVYVAHAMTGKMQDELCREAELTKRVLENYGFEVLDPIIAEGVKDVHEPLIQVSSEQLEGYWRRDKEMIKEADYMGCNKSDGVAKELGYARFCLWKPVVRVFPNCGINVSRIEDDVITSTLNDAIGIMLNRFGSYEKLRVWREDIWNRCFSRWLDEQVKMNNRYGVNNHCAKEII
jgi:nucleoside 2-deoxyribosyltransferase